MTDARAGFSLVEVLVALAIVSIIATAGTGILVTTLNGKDQIAAAAERLREIETARAIITSDVAQVAWRPTRDAFGEPNPRVFSGGLDEPGAPLLAFARGGWENPDAEEERGPIQRVEYVVRDDALVRRVWLRPDPSPETPIVERVLLTGVTRAQVAFHRGERVEPRWEALTTTAPEEGLPRIIELEIELADVGRVRQLFLTSAEAGL